MGESRLLERWSHMEVPLYYYHFFIFFFLAVIVRIFQFINK